jgi:hypothetical protein
MGKSDFLIIGSKLMSDKDMNFLRDERFPFKYVYVLSDTFDENGFFKSPDHNMWGPDAFFILSKSEISPASSYNKNVHNLTDAGYDELFLSSGWYNLENGFHWTRQNATIYGNLKPGKDYELAIETQSPVVDNEITVYANEQIIGDVKSKSESKFVFFIPKNTTNENFLPIRIHVSRVFIPDETMHNGDTRQLGISVKRIKIRELSSTS